ncbi:MAG: hypothetical protein QOE23_1309 [Pseudonocardiales bacterium]|jgi:hypothetical protein|nr:hypothetical protein [Pseudonocardiales bacterium]
MFGRTRLVLLAALVALFGIATPAYAFSTGYFAIASSAASGVSAGHTGYGPGWVALTFDTGGQPHGPIVGYLFHDGVGQAVGNDHMDVYSYYTAGAASVNTPFAGGYAYGHFNGCAWSYLDMNAYELYPEGAHHSVPCTTPPNHTTKIFCYDHAADRLCNDGTSVSDEPEAGVWKNITSHQATIKAGGCDVVGNIGSAAIYSGGAAAPANLIGHVDSGTVYVRYVSKRDDWVMANLATNASPQFPAGIQWGFFPRTCLS